MKRPEWLLALFLILMGVSCLAMAGVGYSTRVLPFIRWAPLFLGCMVLMIILGFLAYSLFKRSKTSSLRCHNCHQVLHPDWMVCPHCASPVQNEVK